MGQLERAIDQAYPIGEVEDFSPYIAKIKASGVDSIITGSWRPDLVLLIKVVRDTELNVNFSPTTPCVRARSRPRAPAVWTR